MMTNKEQLEAKARAEFLAAHVEAAARVAFCLSVNEQARASIVQQAKEIEQRTWALEEMKVDLEQQEKRLPSGAVKFEGKWYLPKGQK